MDQKEVVGWQPGREYGRLRCQWWHRSRMMADYWEDDSEYPVADWQYDVANGATRASYQAWVKGERDAKAAEVANIAPYEEDD